MNDTIQPQINPKLSIFLQTGDADKVRRLATAAWFGITPWKSRGKHRVARRWLIPMPLISFLPCSINVTEVKSGPISAPPAFHEKSIHIRKTAQKWRHRVAERRIITLPIIRFLPRSLNKVKLKRIPIIAPPVLGSPQVHAWGCIWTQKMRP